MIDTHTPPTTPHPAQTASCPAGRTGVRSDLTAHSAGSDMHALDVVKAVHNLKWRAPCVVTTRSNDVS